MSTYSASVVAAAERFGLPVEWAAMHQGRHRCVDGREYVVSCLVTDWTCERAARMYLIRAGVLEAQR